MIFAKYRNDTNDSTFYVEFSNQEPVIGMGDKSVNATYHLENAINKAFDGEDRPERFHFAINDQHNYYLKLIAVAFVAYVRGLGYSNLDIVTKNF